MEKNFAYNTSEKMAFARKLSGPCVSDQREFAHKLAQVQALTPSLGRLQAEQVVTGTRNGLRSVLSK